MWIIASIPFWSLSAISFVFSMLLVASFVCEMLGKNTDEGARSVISLLFYLPLSGVAGIVAAWMVS